MPVKERWVRGVWFTVEETKEKFSLVPPVWPPRPLESKVIQIQRQGLEGCGFVRRTLQGGEVGWRAGAGIEQCGQGALYLEFHSAPASSRT